MPTSNFAQYLCVEAAQLMLVPTCSALPFAIRQVEPVVRETRSDALIVSRPDIGAPTFAMATWGHFETVWIQPLTLWLSAAGAAWLVPPTGDAGARGFELVNTLHHLMDVPFAIMDQRDAGFVCAAR